VALFNGGCKGWPSSLAAPVKHVGSDGEKQSYSRSRVFLAAKEFFFWKRNITVGWSKGSSPAVHSARIGAAVAGGLVRKKKAGRAVLKKLGFGV